MTTPGRSVAVIRGATTEAVGAGPPPVEAATGRGPPSPHTNEGNDVALPCAIANGNSRGKQQHACMDSCAVRCELCC